MIDSVEVCLLFNVEFLNATFLKFHHSVLCGRGKECSCSPGNCRFKAIVKKHLKSYSEARKRSEKSVIVSSILEETKQDAPEGAFVKNECGVWWEVDDIFAREKIGYLFRDYLRTQYKSSSRGRSSHVRRRSKEVFCPWQS